MANDFDIDSDIIAGLIPVDPNAPKLGRPPIYSSPAEAKRAWTERKFLKVMRYRELKDIDCLLAAE